MFTCTECEYTTADWLGRCPNCDSFGTIEERASDGDSPGSSSSTTGSPKPDSRPLTEVAAEKQSRIHTGISELDRVLGGGVVPGSVILLGGPPGIGKSTLLLQWSATWDDELGPVLYVNGEESGSQIARRAERINCSTDRVELISPSTVEALTENLSDWQPSLVVLDSIQTVTSEDSGGSAGSMAQLRALTQAVVRSAKQNLVPFVLVGHVTKQGDIGGPKRLEHMVDTVLYFDDTDRGYRFLRSAKNRFGSTGELGVFEMTGTGLDPVENPGQYFSREGAGDVGSALTVSLEGTRPLLVEIQALVTPSQYGTPQRSATGVPQKRLKMIVAVLEKHLGFPLGTQDIFVNVAGGLKLQDPGTDLAVAMAIASSFQDRPLPESAAWLGEIGLTGRLRTPPQRERRVQEARRRDCGTILVGGDGAGEGSDESGGIRFLGSISDALDPIS